MADASPRSPTKRAPQQRTAEGPLAFPEALIIAAALLALRPGWARTAYHRAAAHRSSASAWPLACGLTLQWALSPPTPGANDNASAVAAMLTCAERARGQLPDDVELWMVGTGAEEVGCCGMHGFVETPAGLADRRTFYVNFECVGGGCAALHPQRGPARRSASRRRSTRSHAALRPPAAMAR